MSVIISYSVTVSWDSRWQLAVNRSRVHKHCSNVYSNLNVYRRQSLSYNLLRGKYSAWSHFRSVRRFHLGSKHVQKSVFKTVCLPNHKPFGHLVSGKCIYQPYQLDANYLINVRFVDFLSCARGDSISICHDIIITIIVSYHCWADCSFCSVVFRIATKHPPLHVPSNFRWVGTCTLSKEERLSKVPLPVRNGRTLRFLGFARVCIPNCICCCW